FRQLGTEYFPGAPERTHYVLLRDGVEIADLTGSTNYLDASGTETSQYSVIAVVDGIHLAASTPVTPWSGSYLGIPLEPPSNGHHASDASAGDLNGDGQLDLVSKWEANNSKDNAQSGVTDNVYLDGLRLE